MTFGNSLPRDQQRDRKLPCPKMKFNLLIQEFIQEMVQLVVGGLWGQESPQNLNPSTYKVCEMETGCFFRILLGEAMK